MWKPLLDRVLPYGFLSVTVIGAMFAVAYLPQLAVLVLFNGPLAVFSTVLLTLNESSMIIQLISRNWLLQDALLDTFDGTLVARNATTVVQQGREVRPGNDPIKKLGKVFKKRFEKISLTSMIRSLIYLPLNFIPVVGTLAFIFLNGGYSYILSSRNRFANASHRKAERQGRAQSSMSRYLSRKSPNAVGVLTFQSTFNSRAGPSHRRRSGSRVTLELTHRTFTL